MTRNHEIPGGTSSAKNHLKVNALKNTMVQGQNNLNKKATEAGMSGLFILAGDMNLSTNDITACLSEIAVNTSQTYTGRSAAASAGDGARISMGSGGVRECGFICACVCLPCSETARPPASLTTRVPRQCLAGQSACCIVCARVSLHWRAWQFEPSPR